MSGFDVIYLTGPPATGKSTLLEALEKALQPMRTFSYSRELAAYASLRVEREYSQDDMRRFSAKVVRPEDVRAVDESLIHLATTIRRESNLVIDSHAVTKEDFGFRVTPFSFEQLARVAPTKIFVLYCESSIVMDRIRCSAQGRPPVTRFEADLHLHLQSSVALSYSIQLGIPAYFFELLSNVVFWLRS